MKNTLSDHIINFNNNLSYHGELPEGFDVMNPFQHLPETRDVMRSFYTKFYNDNFKRKFIIGINPGRLGGGVTGIPFTDTKRLESACGIKMETINTHEVSSVFVYDVIAAYGGPVKFYQDFYINSPFPLAITRQTSKGSWVNANYYDDKILFDMTKEYMGETMRKHIDLGLDTSNVIVLGKKNAKFIQKLNDAYHLFDHMTILDHPRYVQQYKFKERELYINKYLMALNPDQFINKDLNF